ncbi:MAG: EamA/RhaT family transporter [Micavibrio aeruginosavorus]|uniref:EamA/RhaT family transporter n=1 Tax=Micavibrio aeruginosavorus TaxID=349221 RepID=A0A2W5MYQ0_9BACT|nr:MAG: EamA/RhaT family transporter [Micavibrio aeruginosavorus]
MTTPHKDHPLLGMTAAIAAFFCFSVMVVFAKKLAEHHHVIEVAFYRNLIGLIPFLFMIYAMGRRDILIIRSNPRGIVIRSIVGTISLLATFGAFSLMPLADAQAFLFTASLLIPALGFFFLGERVGPFRWVAIIVGFLGVCVMLRPSGDVNVLGVAVALSAACMHAALQTILRYLGKTETPETVTFYFMFIGTFVALIPMPIYFTMPTWQEIPLILGLGLTGLGGQVLISIAYKNAQAAIVTVFNYSSIIWATSFGWIFWNDWPDNAIFIGGGIVIASNVFIVYRENKLAKQATAQVQTADLLD